MPIESMSLSADKKWIATSCHDELIQLWDSNVESNDTEVFEEDLDSAKNQNNSTDECDDSDESLDEKHLKRKPKKTKRSFSKQANPFFAGLD
jgi:WD40 repeat protein